METVEKLDQAHESNAVVIDARYLWKAQQCVSKDEARRAISGILLESDGGIVATNGHILYRADLGTFSLGAPAIVRFLGKIPKAAHEARLFFGEPGYSFAEFFNKKLDKIAVLAFETVTDMTYPEWEKTIPSGPLEPTAEVGFSLEYMEVAKKVIRIGSFELRGENAPVIVRPIDDLGEAAVEFLLIMPARLR